MKPPYLVGIDSGTQSVRVMVFDCDGRLISQGNAVHAPMTVPGHGMVEQDPLDLWEKLCQACRQALKNLAAADRKKIAACSLAAQRSTIVPVDIQGNPLRPAINWMDKRKVNVETCHLPLELLVTHEYSKANWMRVYEPELFYATDKFLPVGGWLNYKLCGDYCDCTGSVAGIWPFDLERLCWSDDPLLYEAYALKPQQMVKLFPPAQVMGRVTKVAAKATGLMEGLPIISGSGDKMCEMLGAGVIQPGHGYITYGTMAGLMINTDTPIFARKGEFWTNPGAVPGKWCLEFAIERGYIMLTWFAQQFGTNRKIPCDMILSMEKEAEVVPPGSQGIVLAPYCNGLGSAPYAKSVMIGLDVIHNRGHFCRAILEGIAFTLRSGQELLERDTGVHVVELMAGGGGASSDLVMQITADVFGLNCSRVQTIETCALGAAIEAAMGVGLFSTYQDAVIGMIHRSRVFYPSPENQHLYDEIYNGIFKRIYPSLEDVFKSHDCIYKMRQ